MPGAEAIITAMRRGKPLKEKIFVLVVVSFILGAVYSAKAQRSTEIHGSGLYT